MPAAIGGLGDRLVRQSLWSAVIAALVLRAAALLWFEGDLNDGTTRIVTAAAWLAHNASVFGRTVWPEGNYLLPALGLAVWPDLYWCPRILYAIVCLAHVPLVFALGNAAIDRRAGLIAAWVVALMPYHVYVSTDGATSEGPYVALVLLALVLMVRYATSPSVRDAGLAGLSLTLATTFRFDGVIWGSALAASLVIAGSRHRVGYPRLAGHLATFGLLGLAYPIAIWLRWSQLYPANPAYILDQAKLNTLQFFVNGHHPRWPDWLYDLYSFAFWPLSLVILLTPAVALLAYAGVASYRVRTNHLALPAALGLLFVGAWLGYETHSHSILAQWRYALVLAIVLSIFVGPGFSRVKTRFEALTGARAVVLAIACALLAQTGITLAAMYGAGSLSRQSIAISPVRSGQFGSRELLRWVDSLAAPNLPVLLTPHTLEQPYLAINARAAERQGKLSSQSYYLPHSQLVHTRASLLEDLKGKMSRVPYVVTSDSRREIGLRDGSTREVVAPACPASDHGCIWEGFEMTLAHRFGNNLVWRIVKTPEPAHANDS